MGQYGGKGNCPNYPILSQHHWKRSGVEWWPNWATVGKNVWRGRLASEPCLFSLVEQYFAIKGSTINYGVKN
eukprot:1154475-Pelagomonas_calceolata.AAC.2